MRVQDVGGYRVAMAEPVLQGVVVHGQTQVLVLPPQGSDAHGSSESPEGLPNGSRDEHDGSTTEEEEADDEELLDFEIDENFLAGSVLSPLRSANTPLTSPLTDSKHSSFPLLSASTASLTPAQGPAPRAGSVVSAVALTHPVPSELLVPQPDADEDDVPRAFVATAELGRLGLFSGDWAVISREGAEAEGRLARVFAADGLVDEAAST